MFTWICPQCQNEVPPSQDECPRCAKRDTPPPLPQEPAAAVPVQQAPAAPQFSGQAPPAAAPVYVPPPAQQPVYAAEVAYAEPKSTTMRDILVTVGVAAVLLGGGYFYWSRQQAAPTAETSAPESAPIESVAGAKPHPLARQVEVTGVRLRTPKAGQAEVTVLVVNHSAAEIGGLKVDVVLMAKGTNREVAAFPLPVKRLAPFASQELTAKTKVTMSGIDLPDWQFLEPRITLADTF